MNKLNVFSKIQNFLKNSVEVIFIFLIMTVFAIVTISSVKNSSVISLILFIPVICLIFFLYRLKNKASHRLKKDYYRIWLIVRVLCFILMTVICYSLDAPLSVDWRVLAESAYNYTIEYSLTKEEMIYLARYPNNKLLECLLIIIIKVSSKFIKDITINHFRKIIMAFALLFTQITIEMIYRSAVLLWNKEKALYVSIFSMMFIPFYQYSGILYTDVPICCFVSVMFYLYLLIEKSTKQRNKIILSVIFGILSALAFMMKLTSVILLIAIVICLFIRKHTINIKQIISMILVFILTFGIVYTVISKTETEYFDENLGITEEFSEKYEFPFTHWIMMGLGSTGAYSQEDCNYTMDFNTKQTKITANMLEIYKRWNSRTFTEFVKHLYNKMYFTFSYCCFKGDAYTINKDAKTNIFSRILTKNGDLYNYCKYYSFALYLFILFGMICSSVFSIINKHRTKANDKLLIARLSVVGIILYNLLSECNPRYVIIFLPFFLIIACDGYLILCRNINKLINKKNTFSKKHLKKPG